MNLSWQIFYHLQRSLTLQEFTSIWMPEKKNSSTFTWETGALLILDHVWRVYFKQTLTTTVCSIILLITLLTPTIFYQQWNKTLNFSLILKLKEQEKFDNCSDISTDQEHQTLKHICEREWYVTYHRHQKFSQIWPHMAQLDLYYKMTWNATWIQI